MTHIRNMLILMTIAPATALVCWAIWAYLMQ